MSVPFVEARWKTVTSGRQLDLIVIHTAEVPEKPTSAEAVANYFRTTDRKVSAHLCADADSLVRCVRDKDVAYAAPGANHNGLHVELSGYAAQRGDEWEDSFSDAMLRRVAEFIANDWLALYSIPVQWVNVAGLRAGLQGFTSHVNVSVAFGRSSHTDPGPNFPHERFLNYVRYGVAVPPSSRSSTRFEADKMTRHNLSIPVGGDGRGYNDLPVLKDKVVGVTLNGNNPATSGWKRGFHQIETLSVGAATRVVLKAAEPGAGQIDVAVWVAD